MMSELIRWLLESGEPWTRYRTLVDPLDRPEDDAEVQAARAEMVDTIAGRADEGGRYTAASMYTAWKGWSFADKKTPSPWLTFLALRIQKRAEWRRTS